MSNPIGNAAAFPCPASDARNSADELDGNPHQPGMTMRDWFAGRALSMFAGKSEDFDNRDIAERCYAVADAMLAARNGTLDRE